MKKNSYINNILAKILLSVCVIVISPFILSGTLLLFVFLEAVTKSLLFFLLQLNIRVNPEGLNAGLLVLLAVCIVFEIYTIKRLCLKKPVAVWSIIGNVLLLLTLCNAIVHPLLLLLGKYSSITPIIPGRWPDPEDHALLLLFIMAATTLVSVSRWFLKRNQPLKIVNSVSKVAFMLFLVCLIPINDRQFGSWVELRQQLNAYAKVVAVYSAEKGVIDSQDKTTAFYQEHPQIEFTFADGKTKVAISYFSWFKPASVGIDLQGPSGNYAVLNLNNMLSLYSDWD